MGRSPCCDKANVKRGPWSPEEDATLKSYIEKHGTGGNWITLPHKIGLKRCGKSCRLRWLNYLRPNIKHGGFTEDEDNLICSLYVSIGSRWSIIAAQLPGRTDNDIKNYWNTKLKKKLLGRQRREASSLKRSVQNYPSINNMNLSPYNNEVTQTHPDINIVSMMMPPFESRFAYDQNQTNIYNTAHHDHDHRQRLDFKANDLQALDEIQQDVMYCVGQVYGGDDYSSAVDMVNCCAVLPESTVSWGGITDLHVHPSALSSYQLCQIKIPQDFSFLIGQGY